MTTRTISLGHKIRLNPTEEQEEYFNQSAGCHRFVYNWALDEYKKILENGGKPNLLELKKYFNSIYKEKFPFIIDVHRDVRSQPFSDLGTAFTNFFRTLKKNGSKKVKFPKFKSKKRSKSSFYIANDKVIIEGNWIRIPKIGWVNMAEQLRFEGKLLSVRVSKQGKHWFASANIEFEINDYINQDRPVVGIDLGIKVLMTLSDEDFAENQRLTVKHEKKLRRLNKKLSRQVEGSKNWWKTVDKLRTLHEKIKNQRQDYIHNLTTKLTDKYSLIAIEDLNASGMLRNRKLAKHIADVSFFEIKRQLEYKQYLGHCQIIKIDRFFPSSKMCSECGCIDKQQTLADRVYNCTECGLVIDRDLNAAINIRNEGLRLAKL